MSIHNIEWPVIFDRAHTDHLAIKLDNKYWTIAGDSNDWVLLAEVSDGTLADIFNKGQKEITMQEWLQYARQGLYTCIPKHKLIIVDEKVSVMKVN